EVAAAVGGDEWERRLKEAQDEAEVLAQALARVRAGESRSAALRALLPDRPVASTLRRLRRFEQGGRDGLVDLHVPVRPVLKMDDHARGALRAHATSHPELGSIALAERLSELLDTTVR